MLFPLSLCESSTTSIFNLTGKTQVFLKILTLPFFWRKHSIPSIGGSKKAFKICFRDVPKPFQKALRIQLRVGSASVTGLERFWTPKSPLKQGLEVSPRPSETASLHLDLLGGLQNRFWRLLGPLRPGFRTIFGYHFRSKIQSEA